MITTGLPVKMSNTVVGSDVVALVHGPLPYSPSATFALRGPPVHG